MSDETFRLVVAVGVLIASIAFVVQAAIMFALYGLTRKVQEKTEGFIGEIGPVLGKVEPILDRVGPAIDAIQTATLKAGPAIERALPLIDKTVIIAERASALIKNANELVEGATKVAASTNQIILDARPQISEISGEVVAMVHSGREQVERVGELLHDAGDRARARLEQVDHTVENTVNKIENVSGAVKNVVLRPVREVNGLAAGISAALASVIRGQRKSSVDSATQDEEMFI